MDKKLTEEIAEQQLQVFLDYYELEAEDLTEKQINVYETVAKRIKKSIRKGRLTIEGDLDNLKMTYKTKNGHELSFKELTGKAKLAMKSDSHDGQTQELIGYLTGEGASVISDLSGADLSVMESLGLLFLLV